MYYAFQSSATKQQSRSSARTLSLGTVIKRNRVKSLYNVTWGKLAPDLPWLSSLFTRNYIKVHAACINIVMSLLKLLKKRKRVSESNDSKLIYKLHDIVLPVRVC